MLTFQKVLRVLNAHRDAHKIIGQAAGSAHIRGNGGVAHVAGQRDEGRDAAEADRDLEQLRLLCYCPAGLDTACQIRRMR